MLAFLFWRIPMIHLKRAWPLAQIQAFVGNALGGKSSGGKSLPSWKVFQPQEFLPGYARPEGFEMEELMPPHICALLESALEAGLLKGASWVVQMVDLHDSLDRVLKVGEEYNRVKAEEEEAAAGAVGDKTEDGKPILLDARGNPIIR